MFMLSIPALRQSTAELVAFAILDLFPGSVLVGCFPTELGFYCDITAQQQIDEYALPLLEEKVRGFVKNKIAVQTLEMMRENAAQYLQHKGQSIRAKVVLNSQENIVSLIEIAGFCDFCPSPHMKSTEEVEFFKLLKIEPVITYIPNIGEIEVKRIHGIVALDKQELKKQVKALQQGNKASHLTLIQNQDWFYYEESLSDLSWVWKSDGYGLKIKLIDFWQEEHRKQGFQLISSPLFIKEALLHKAKASNDSSSLIFSVNDAPYVLPDTTSPSHMVLFAEKKRSIRELPIRYAECSTVFKECSADLWGVFNSKIISSDCAHIFCAFEHLENEIISSLQFINKIIKIFGFKYHWSFVGQGRKFAGTEKKWQRAVECIQAAFKATESTFTINESQEAFKGPLLEAFLIDQFGREWKGPTIEINFNGPDRLDLRFQAEDGKTYKPLMIVRSLFGSFERFAALLLEHYSGALPFWLAPEHVRILPVENSCDAYAKEVMKIICEAGFNVQIDFGYEPISKKIGKAKDKNIPCIVILGENEKDENVISLHSSIFTMDKQKITIESLLKLMNNEIGNRKSI